MTAFLEYWQRWAKLWEFQSLLRTRFIAGDEPLGRRFEALAADFAYPASLPVIEAHCEFHRPARYDDELEVRTEGRMLSPVRMEFNYDVVRRDDRSLAAAGRTVHAALDPGGRPCRLPERIREVFA